MCVPSEYRFVAMDTKKCLMNEVITSSFHSETRKYYNLLTNAINSAQQDQKYLENDTFQMRTSNFKCFRRNLWLSFVLFFSCCQIHNWKRKKKTKQKIMSSENNPFPGSVHSSCGSIDHWSHTLTDCILRIFFSLFFFWMENAKTVNGKCYIRVTMAKDFFLSFLFEQFWQNRNTTWTWTRTEIQFWPF